MASDDVCLFMCIEIIKSKEIIRCKETRCRRLYNKSTSNKRKSTFRLEKCWPCFRKKILALFVLGRSMRA